MILDFKSHRCLVAGLSAFNVANRDVWRLTGNDEQYREKEKDHEHNRTGDDGLRFHSRQHSGFGVARLAQWTLCQSLLPAEERILSVQLAWRMSFASFTIEA